MVDLTDEGKAIAQAFQKEFKFSDGTPAQVEARIKYNHYGLDQPDQNGIELIVKHRQFESAPGDAEKVVLAGLAGMAPLKDHIVTEPTTDHMKRLAADLNYIREQETLLNKSITGTPVTHIYDKLPQWFEELAQRNEWDLQHAFRISIDEFGVVRATATLPKDVDPNIVLKNFEGRMPDIIAAIAGGVQKYPNTQEDKNAAIEAAKHLIVIPKVMEGETDKTITFEIMSKLQHDDSLSQTGLSKDKINEYLKSNPLTGLQNGDNDADKKAPLQPHLKKVVSRALLLSGASYIEVFHFLAGREDMKRHLEELLGNVKEKAVAKPQIAGANLVTKIDDFLKDPVFKDPMQWRKPAGKQEFVPEFPRFSKITGISRTSMTNAEDKGYEPGVMQIDISLPNGKKFEEIRNQLIAMGNAPATAAKDTAASAAAPATPQTPAPAQQPTPAEQEALLKQAIAEAEAKQPPEAATTGADAAAEAEAQQMPAGPSPVNIPPNTIQALLKSPPPNTIEGILARGQQQPAAQPEQQEGNWLTRTLTGMGKAVGIV